MDNVFVTGSFDDLRSRHVRFLEEAAKLGRVSIALWPDDAVLARTGALPKFPERERSFLLESLRFVDRVFLAPDAVEPDVAPSADGLGPFTWVVDEVDDNPAKRQHADALRILYRVLRNDQLSGFPVTPFDPRQLGPSRKRVLVTGSYDWFHSGHVRFFEEAAALGDLYVIVGHDANIRLLKGEGHPLLPQSERLYMAHSVRLVRAAMISTGNGWLDAEPEIELIQPHYYVVNEDGDRPQKREFCARKGIEYVVLKRTPKEGLPRRESTALRGF
jgi:cytidyltransferase-like protein